MILFAKDGKKRTVLHVAARYKQKTIFEYLLNVMKKQGYSNHNMVEKLLFDTDCYACSVLSCSYMKALLPDASMLNFILSHTRDCWSPVYYAYMLYEKDDMRHARFLPNSRTEQAICNSIISYCNHSDIKYIVQLGHLLGEYLDQDTRVCDYIVNQDLNQPIASIVAEIKHVQSLYREGFIKVIQANDASYMHMKNRLLPLTAQKANTIKRPSTPPPARPSVAAASAKRQRPSTPPPARPSVAAASAKRQRPSTPPPARPSVTATSAKRQRPSTPPPARPSVTATSAKRQRPSTPPPARPSVTAISAKRQRPSTPPPARPSVTATSVKRTRPSTPPPARPSVTTVSEKRNKRS